MGILLVQQAAFGAPQKRRQPDAEIENFISSVQSLPPEFAADLMIKLVERMIKDPAREQELLVDAFYTATRAKLRFKLEAVPQSLFELRSGYRRTAPSGELDTLTLQCRAVKELLRINKKKARQLFNEIKFTFEPLSCDDSFTYDTDIFFSTLLAMAREGFSAAEQSRREHIQFVQNYLSKINSPSHVSGAGSILNLLTASDLELSTLAQVYSAALQRIPSDYRSFSSARASTGVALHWIMRKFDRRQLSLDELLHAYRAYLINQLSGSRCSDPTAPERETESGLVHQFNGIPRTNLAAISEDEIKPAQREDGASAAPYWGSPKAQKILSGINGLRFGPNGGYSDLEKLLPEGQLQLSEFIKEMAQWEPEDEKSEENYFHQKAIIYRSLITTIPADPRYDGQRDEALRGFVTLIVASPLQKEKPSDWFIYAKDLLEKFGAAEPRERDKLRSLINNSRCTVLQLYLQQQERPK